MGASSRSAQVNYSRGGTDEAQYGDGNIILRRGLVAPITKDINKVGPHLRGNDGLNGNYPERTNDWRISF